MLGSDSGSGGLEISISPPQEQVKPSRLCRPFQFTQTDLFLIIADFLKNKVGQCQGSVERRQFAPDGVVRQVDIGFVDQFMLHFGPSLLEDRPQLDFADVGAVGQAGSGFRRGGPHQQMHRIVTEFTKRVLLRLVLHLQNFTMFGNQPLHDFQVFQERADNPDSQQIGNLQSRIILQFAHAIKFFAIIIETFDPVLDRDRKASIFGQFAKLLLKFLQSRFVGRTQCGIEFFGFGPVR